MGGRAGIVGTTGEGDAGEGEAGRGVTTVDGSGKFKPWNWVGAPAVAGLPVVETKAVKGRGVVGRGVGEKVATVV